MMKPGKLSKKLSYHNQTSLISNPKGSDSLLTNLRYHPYPDSGTHIIHTDRIYLCVSAGPNGQKDLGGHCHNDKLSFELSLDGKDLVLDPGTYLYTPSPSQRNYFRSSANHNIAIVKNKEQNRVLEGLKGLFSCLPDAKCTLIDSKNNDNEFQLTFQLRYQDITQIRLFMLTSDALYVDDYSSHPFEALINPFSYYSNGYGKLQLPPPGLFQK